MKRILKKYLQLLSKRQKRNIVILFFIMLIGAFMEVAGVSLMIPLLTTIMQPDITEENYYVKLICDILNIQSSNTFVLLCILTLIFVFIVKDLFIIFQYYAQNRFAYNSQFDLQKRLLHAYMKQPYEYYLYADSGEILRTVQTDAANVYALLSSLLSMMTELVVSGALLITVFVIAPMMTIMIGIVMGSVMLVIIKLVKPKLREQGKNSQKHMAATNKWLIQAINGMKEIKVAQKEEFFEKNYEASGRRMIHAHRYYTILQNTPRLIIEMFSVSSMLMVIGIMVCGGENVNSLIPILGAFAMAAVKLLPSANRITTAVNSIVFYEPVLDKLLAVLKEQKEFDGKDDTTVYTGNIILKKEISLSNISYSYPNSKRPVLRGVSMAIPIGKSVGIVGASGAGKTTLVDIILGLLNPMEGQVRVDGKDVKDYYQEWLAHIGYIPQAIFMMDGSIRDNVAFGVETDTQTDEKVWRALEKAQLSAFVKGLPEGLDTQIGERGIRVSGGQRQRIGIARALFSNPDLLIFDEATSALDNETETALMESVNALHGQKTMIIIAHRLTTIEGCDIVYRVESGKVIKER